MWMQTIGIYCINIARIHRGASGTVVSDPTVLTAPLWTGPGFVGDPYVILRRDVCVRECSDAWTTRTGQYDGCGGGGWAGSNGSGRV